MQISDLISALIVRRGGTRAWGGAAKRWWKRRSTTLVYTLDRIQKRSDGVLFGPARSRPLSATAMDQLWISFPTLTLSWACWAAAATTDAGTETEKNARAGS
jgi:hypothetical protein